MSLAIIMSGGKCHSAVGKSERKTKKTDFITPCDQFVKKKRRKDRLLINWHI